MVMQFARVLFSPNIVQLHIPRGHAQVARPIIVVYSRFGDVSSIYTSHMISHVTPLFGADQPVFCQSPCLCQDAPKKWVIEAQKTPIVTVCSRKSPHLAETLSDEPPTIEEGPKTFKWRQQCRERPGLRG